MNLLIYAHNIYSNTETLNNQNGCIENIQKYLIMHSYRILYA